ncbi:BTAD domain-containing putative transcriptional regulator [Micromonospora okii]|uniref:BTAD domain-containing putative transcriptional regulator n=1 Tax=Micromonospora okii TaxID=1182970 RepID=UPI001E4422CF|nr:BTAD domain-containing putative transcriptional regulator [Micromonospora okii]
MPFGASLRAARERAGLTQRELADRADVNIATIRDLEQGRSRLPRPASLDALVGALGLAGEAAELVRAAATARRKPTPQPDSPPGHPADELSVAVLGPLRVRCGSHEIELTSTKQRRILVRLALSAGEVVGREDLIELLWGYQRPPQAQQLLQSHVGRLRRKLRLPDATKVLRLAGDGYRLTLAPQQLDLLRFRRLVALGADEATPELTGSHFAAAALLWRGETDVEALRDHPVSTALRHQYAQLLRSWAALTREFGGCEQVLPPLRELARQFELDEPLHAELMMTLSASGRQAEALATYQRIRAALVDQLGIEPSPELRQAHDYALRRHELPAPAPAHRPVPQQAPAPPSGFVGRATELGTIGAALAGGGPEEGQVSPHIVMLSGAAGVGKTALALKAAHQLRAAYPDGQLYVDLRGGAGVAVAPIEVLGRFLRALGVPARQVGADEAEASAALRSELADRRMLLVLDNAREAAQVRPLLPGPGHCDVLVTSRWRLPGLADATVVDVATLPLPDAVKLISDAAGRRPPTDPRSTQEVALACGKLPLALRIVAARLANRPAWSADDLARRLRDVNGRLAELSAGDSSVLASFQLSYQELSEAARRAFRLCALHPGDDFGLDATAEALNLDPVAADAVVCELLDGNMLLQSTAERFRFHDLLGLYAGKLLAAGDPGERDAARGRLHAWYLEHLIAAMGHVSPHAVQLPTTVTGRAGAFAGQEQALEWLDREAAGLVALVEQTAEPGQEPVSWQVADQLRGYFLVRRHVDRWLRTAEAGLRAATKAADDAAQAALLISRGQAMWALGRHREALDDYRAGALLAESCAWREAAAYLWHTSGVVQAEQGMLDDAQESYRRALALCGDESAGYVRSLALSGLGAMYVDQGRLRPAAECFTAALRLNQRAGREASALSARGNLGMVLRQLGELDQAETCLTAALAGYRRRSSMHGELSILDEISQLHRQRGAPAAAASAAREGYDVALIVRDQRAQVALLTSLGEAHLAGLDVPEATRCFLRAQAMARQHHYPYFDARAGVGLAGAFLHTGDRDAAQRACELAHDTARAHGFRILEADALAVRADCLAEHDAGTASRLLDEAASIYRAAGADRIADALVRR